MKAEQLLLDRLKEVKSNWTRSKEKKVEFESRKYYEYRRWSEQVEIYLLTKTAGEMMKSKECQDGMHGFCNGVCGCICHKILKVKK